MRDNDVVAALNICTTLEEFPAVAAVAEQHAHVFASAAHPDNQGVEEPTVERWSSWPIIRRSSQSAKPASTTFACRSRSIGSAPVPHAHPRGASVRKAADHSYARIAGGHDTFDAGGGRRQGRGRDALFHRVACRGTSGNGSRLLYLVFGIVTFKNAQALQEVARAVPLTGC